MFGWTTETFDTGGGEVALFRLPGYEPQQPVRRDVVAVMLEMGSHGLPKDLPTHPFRGK